MRSHRSRFPYMLIGSLAVLSTTAAAQTQPVIGAPPVFGDGNTRLGIGYDSIGKLRGEVFQRLGGGERSAWIGEAWVGDRSGGAQVDYQWYPDDSGPVWKIFGAWDRNQWNDQKLSLGGGAETEAFFWGAYLSKGLTGDRDLGAYSTTVTNTRTGTDPTYGDYVQDVTTTTTIRTFERAYDYGVGARLGKVFPSVLVRVVGGLDYEWHQSSVALTTASIGLEKFFANSNHSILVTAAASDRRGETTPRQSDHRAGIYWRYQFGGLPRTVANAAPATSTQGGATPAITPASKTTASTGTPEPARNDGQPAITTESVAAETFFDLDRSRLKPESFEVLDRIVSRLKSTSIDGPVKVIGHTCNLGPAAYNQKLSERRAAAVRDYLVAAGGLPADRVVAVGMGEDDPRYPNTRAERHKNRRCDIEFVAGNVAATPAPVATNSPRAQVADVVPPAAPVSPPEAARAEPESYPWWQRALRNPVSHKREVDTYTRRETSTQVVEGNRQYLNQAPVAVADMFSWYGSKMPAILNVLANDSDPDGDTLRVVSVTNGSNGDVTILPDNRLQYIWRSPTPGVDTFTYTIVDTKGATSTTTVMLYVIDP